MDAERFAECMRKGVIRCEELERTPFMSNNPNEESLMLKDSMLCNLIDKRLFKLDLVKVAMNRVYKGELDLEQALILMVNIMGNQILSINNDVNLYEMSKYIENNIDAYKGKPIFTVIGFYHEEGDSE